MRPAPCIGFAVGANLANYGLSRALSENYAAAFRRLGFRTAIVTLAPGERSAVARLLQPDIRLWFSHGGWLMSPTGPLGDKIAAVLRKADKPAIVLAADPPYSAWLPPIFANLPPRAAVFSIDPGFTDGIAHWVPSGLQAPYLPCSHLLDGHARVATEAKTIPLLFVGAVGDLDEVRRLAHRAPSGGTLFDDLVERALASPEMPLFGIAGEVMAAHGRPASMDDPALRHLLHLADLFVRYRHRKAAIDALLRYPVHLVANIDPSGPGRHPGAVVLPAQPFTRMLALMRQARTTVVCQPPYPGAVNERIVFAMQAGCAVITTPTPRTRQVFSHGTHLLFSEFDGSDLDDRIEALVDDSVHRTMCDAGATAVGNRFTPDGNVRYMLQAMQSHGLLDDDLPVPAGPRLVIPPLSTR